MILRDNPRARLRLTACFLSAAQSQHNSAPHSLFRRKRRYAQMWGAGAKCDFACASDYNLPPSLREASRQSRDGGSSCPPCAREGGAAKLRRKGCLAINSLQKASLRYAFCAPICRSRGFQEGVNAPSAIMKALMGRRREEGAVSLRRTRSRPLRSRNFVVPLDEKIREHT